MELTLANSDINAQDQNGNTALMFAAVLPAEESLPQVREIVESGAELDAQNVYGNTAMLLAILVGNNHSAKFLLDCGADPSIHNKQGQSCSSLLDERIEARQLLLEKLQSLR